MGTDKRDRQKEGRRQRLEQAYAEYRRQRRRRRFLLAGVLLVLVALAAIAVAALTGDDGESVATEDTAATTLPSVPTTAPVSVPLYGGGSCPPPEGVDEPVTSFDDRPAQCIDPAKTYTAVFDTTQGTIRVELDTQATPATVNNFVTLARYGYYDGTKIFRTDPSIGIIQGGSPTTNDPSDPGPGYTIADEGSGYTYEPGQLVMARSSGPNSASAQFFFVANDAAAGLNEQGTYVVFGNTVEGLDVIEAVLASHQDDPSNPLGGAPNPEVTINSVTIEEG